MSDRKILTLQEYVNHPEDIEVGDIAASLLECDATPFTKAGKKEPTNEELFDGGIIRHVASDETLDRHGDIVTAKGWNLDDYLKNPVILWAHSHKDLPVGKALDIGVRRKRLIANGEYPSQELYEFGNTVYRLAARQYLKAVSVGFMPTKFELLDENDPWGGVKVMEQDLWEYSVVPVPANPNALQLAAKEIGGYDAIQRWAEQILDTSPVPDTSISKDHYEKLFAAFKNFTGRLAGISFDLPVTQEVEETPEEDVKEENDMVDQQALLSETRDHEEDAFLKIIEKKDPVILRIVDEPTVKIDGSELQTLVADAVMKVTGKLVDRI